MILSSRFNRTLLLLTAAFTALVAVNATQVMHRPDNYKDAPHKFATGNSTAHVVHKRAGAKAQMAYFTNWGIYGANFQPADIVTGPLTHILYAFADVSAGTGALTLTDPYADEQKHYPTDSWSETGNNLYGCLKQLYLLKQKKRNLKVSLSVGGWTYSQAGHFGFVTDATKRATFISSALKIIEDYGFDGIDLDFEYPGSTEQGQGFADLLTALRSSLNSYAAGKGDKVPYLLTAAVSAGVTGYQYLNVPQMDKALDYWNLMAYDYAGSWLTYADNQANLYGGARTRVSTDQAIKWYLSKGATASKIVMGIPLYGRAFENTTGIGAPYNGIGPGTFEAGVYSYNVLPLSGATVYENLTDVASYSYNSANKELVSYDTPHIANLKAQYVSANGLAGSMFWELSTDKVGTDSLVGTTAGVYGSLDQSQNHLSYPNSKWDNIRNQMGTSPGGGSTTSTPPTSTTTSGGSTPTGGCAGVAAWSSTVAYTGGQSVVYNSHLWTASWWTQGDTPGSSVGVWVDKGAC